MRIISIFLAILFIQMVSAQGSPAIPNYTTSDTLSEITFTRDFEVPDNVQSGVGILSEKTTFKLTGYLKEIDPDSDDLTRYSDRAFEFENGTVEWHSEQIENDGSTRCMRTSGVKGSGKERISDLNIPYNINDGKDLNGNLVHVDSYNLKLKYNKNGLSGHPELSIVGKVLIPIEYTHSEIPVDATCNGNDATETFTRKDVVQVWFPLTLLDVDPTNDPFSGSLVGREPVENELEGTVLSGDPSTKFDGLVKVSPIVTLGTDGPWDVSWNIDVPNKEDIYKKDSDKDKLPDINETQLGTDPNNPDTDGDGLLDGWEVLGVFKNGKKVVDLPSMGTDPLKKDLFLEIDWMDDGTNSYKPENNALQIVVNAFANKSIYLHIDTGQWGGGNPIAFQPNSSWHKYDSFSDDDERTRYEANNKYLFDIKKNNFNKNRLGIFRYALFVAPKEESSGQAELGGNLYVALEYNDTINRKAGTLMHELGHTLGLGHGGRRVRELVYDNTHFKPNYRR